MYAFLRFKDISVIYGHLTELWTFGDTDDTARTDTMKANPDSEAGPGALQGRSGWSGCSVPVGPSTILYIILHLAVGTARAQPTHIDLRIDLQTARMCLVS